MLRTAQKLTLGSSRYFARDAVAPPQASVVNYSYFVPRNTRGNLPVYTDVRNGGTRYQILIRNIDGNANILANDLATSLFEKGSPEASRIKMDIVRSKNLIISGGRWRSHVVEWLKEKGF
ncbi:mitochondrial large subunit ribosomal protein-domain-containing protein [Infundibulicybe gibba]|nr:mitochondrial large subunit ribosomal protein-domain-containing protein [Infundibulicybe gibba]